MRHTRFAVVGFCSMLAVGVCSMLLAAPLAAQQTADTITIDRIVVTATKVPVPVQATGTAVTVITGQDLRNRGIRRVVDALQTVPGVAVAQLGGTGAVASVFMRGGESDYVQILVDGVQVNDPGGSFDWAHLTTDDIDRIEVVRGPVSVLYGSSAVSGVVQIFTRAGSARTDAHLQVMGGRGERTGPGASGSYGSSDVNGGIATGFGVGGTSFRLGANASRLGSDGSYAFNNEYDNTTLSAKASAVRGDRVRAELSARSVDQTFHYPTDGGGAVVDHNQRTDGNSLALGFLSSYRLTQRLEAVAQLTSYRSNTGGDNPEDAPGDGFSRSTTDVRREAAEARVNAYLPAGITATAGAEVDREKGISTFDSDGPFGPFNSATSDERTNRGYFTQVIAAPARRIALSGGVRIDDSDQFGHFTTGRASATVRVIDGVTARAAVGTAFKEPTFIESYSTGFSTGNPDLRPEHTRSAEAGIELRHGSVTAGATYFAQRFRDLIQYTFATPEPNAPNYYNVGRARADGIEVTGSAAVLPRTTVSAQYTHVASRTDDEGFGADLAFVSGERLLRRPSDQASATVAAGLTSALSASLSVLYIGDRDDLDFTDPSAFAGKRVVLPSHTTVDAAASWRVPVRNADASVMVRVANLLDARYEEVFNFPAPRRLVSVGVAVSVPSLPDHSSAFGH